MECSLQNERAATEKQTIFRFIRGIRGQGEASTSTPPLPQRLRTTITTFIIAQRSNMCG